VSLPQLQRRKTTFTDLSDLILSAILSRTPSIALMKREPSVVGVQNKSLCMDQ